MTFSADMERYARVGIDTVIVMPGRDQALAEVLRLAPVVERPRDLSSRRPHRSDRSRAPRVPVEGDGGHLDGMLAIPKAGEMIRKFLGP